MFQKLLIVHSFRDEGAEARIRAIESSPDLDGLNVRNICIFDRERAPELTAAVDKLHEQRVQHGNMSKDHENRMRDAMRTQIKDDFIPAMRDLIADHGTEVGLFHSGTIFSLYTGPLLQGTIDLGEEFPIQWALEDQGPWLTEHSRRAGNLWGFERKAAVAQIRHIRNSFASGAEVDNLLKAAFG